jgi:hypothetical protein
MAMAIRNQYGSHDLHSSAITYLVSYSAWISFLTQYCRRPTDNLFIDYSPATQGSLADECDIDEDKVSAACLEYGSKIEELNKLLADQVPHLNNVKTLADDLQKIKLIVTKNQPAPDSPQVRAALEHAKAMSAEHGTTSPEAKVAWDSLEEIASSGLSNAMGAGLDQECLVESAMEACLALEELNRVLNLEKSKNEGANS